MSRQRSAARAAARCELIRELLRHGTRFVEPRLEVVAAAEWLAGLGLVALHRGRAVRCANPLDPDFPLMRDCDGLIPLRPEVDEGGGDYRCPDCARIVFPEADCKREFDTLGVRLRQDGIEAFLIDVCGELASGRSFVGGVLTLPVHQINAAVCLVDYCSEASWLGGRFGINQRCVYVTAGPEVAARMLGDDAVAHVELVDMLLGLKDLPAILIERVSRLPAGLAYVDPLVYALGPRPIASEPEDPGAHIFHVWLSPAGFLVDGLLALRATRTTANLIMRVLIQRLTSALPTGGSVEPMSADHLADAVEEITGDVQDADTIRRQISRMRRDIIDTIHRHTGKPIGEHDIIETVSRSGAEAGGEGYRLNPATVALMHFEP